MTFVSRLCVLGVVAMTAGCRAPPQAMSAYTIVGGDPQRVIDVPNVSQAEWTLSRERLARMRVDQPQRPYVERVRVGVVDPRNGKLYEARGAVAVSPNNAARLLLVGPGGTTALDVWVTRDRFRFAVPAINLEKPRRNRARRDARDCRSVSCAGGSSRRSAASWFSPVEQVGGGVPLARRRRDGHGSHRRRPLRRDPA